MMLGISKLVLKIFNSGKHAILKVLELMYIKVKRKTFWWKHHKENKRDHVDIAK